MRAKGTIKSNVREPSKPRAGHVGFEPTKCRNQNPVPYRLVNALYLLPHESYGKYLTEHYGNANEPCGNCLFFV
nr:MAG TPA: hypothetical protein [Caudoviricetes sp.]